MTEIKRIPLCAVALCAGYSRRMETNKLFITFDAQPLYRHTLAVIERFAFQKKIVVTQYEEIARYGGGLGFAAVMNTDSQTGISASVRLGVQHAGDVQGYMFFPCDQPFLDERTLQALIGSFEASNKITVPCAQGQSFAPCIFPSRFKHELLALSGESGGKQIASRHPEETVFVSFDDALPFYDIDTPEDLYRALRL